jgi:hypothetical protein
MLILRVQIGAILVTRRGPGKIKEIKKIKTDIKNSNNK